MCVKFSEDVIPLTDLEVDPGRVVTQPVDAHRPELLNGRGRGAAVIESLSDYEQGAEERLHARGSRGLGRLGCRPRGLPLRGQGRIQLGIEAWASVGSAPSSPLLATWRASMRGTQQKECRRFATGSSPRSSNAWRSWRPPGHRADRSGVCPTLPAPADPPALPDRLSPGPVVTHPHRSRLAQRTVVAAAGIGQVPGPRRFSNACT
jgi:hypothetical protein